MVLGFRRRISTYNQCQSFNRQELDDLAIEHVDLGESWGKTLLKLGITRDSTDSSICKS